jgi:hypothetical protein
MTHSPEAKIAFEERPHLYFGSLQKGNPHAPAGRSHQREEVLELSES